MNRSTEHATSPRRSGRRLVATVALVAGSVGLVATPVGATAPAPPSDADLAMASINLSLFLIENLEAATSGTLDAPCPFLTQEAINAQLAARGLTPTNDGYVVDAFYDDDLEAAKISCGVDVVDVFNTPNPAAPHGITIDGFTLGSDFTFADVLEPIAGSSVIVPDAPGIGGEIGGSCVDDGVSGLCYLFWHRNELVLSVALAGPLADVTQDVAVQLLTDIVPLAVASLVAYDGFGSSPPSTDAPTTVAPVTTAAPVVPAPTAVTAVPPPTMVVDPTATTVYVKPQPGTPVAPTVVVAPTTATTTTAAATGLGALVPAATASLDGYLAAHPIGTEGTPEAGLACPMIDSAGLAGAMTAQGLEPNMAGFEVNTLERTDWTAGLAYVSCGVNTGGALAGTDPTQPPHYASIDAYDITGAFTWEQVVASVAASGVAVDAATGGDLVGGCSGEMNGNVFCARLWHLDGLVIRVSLVGPPASVTVDSTTQLLVALVPTAVTNLADATFIIG